MVRVGIVIPNWNGRSDTLACIAALRTLAYDNTHVIVVDNGSTDDSVAAIRSAYPDVTVVELERNLGFAGGSNRGIEAALESGAELVWLLNNDTLPDPNALTALVAEMERQPRVGLVGSVLRYAHAPDTVQAWGGGRIDWRIGIPVHCRNAADFARADYIVGASLLVRRAVFEEIGMLDEGFFLYWEDADFALRARAAGWGIAVAADSVVLHKEGASASGGARRPSLGAELEHIRSLARLLRKHRRQWRTRLLVRGLLEVPNKIRRGQPGRILPILGAVASEMRGAVPAR